LFVCSLLVAVREVLLPFMIGIILAYVLTPGVAWGESRLRLPRSLSIVGVYVVVLGTVVLSIWGMAPRIYEETTRFAREVPSMARGAAHNYGPRVERWVNGYQSNVETIPATNLVPATAITVTPRGEGFVVELGEGISIIEEEKGHFRVTPELSRRAKSFQVTGFVDEAVERVINYAQLNAMQFIRVGQLIVVRLSRGILLVFMTLMVAAYLMHTRESVLTFFRSLTPSLHRPGFELLLKRMDRGLSGVVRGQLIICVVNGVLSAIGFAFFGLKYWPALALLAGVMSIIPIFGSILSTVPAVFVGLTQDAWTGLWVLLWILGIHQLEANLLNPKIIGDQARLHPVLVVFSLLVGEHFYGLWGAILAVPTLSITQSIFNHFWFSLSDCRSDSLLPPDIKSEVPR
jgi:predicted PurR-regulated permease PerM